ncbi:MAG: tRNA (adenosine(37)-N6)-threonylcarbamoyltransferase complex ATPase subunit type 1 TsaE [Coriobacteriales bacterium]|nr:tRNA (adenosine(37)-N6)-threonylcarbamoyltransferase complex ATPase subunit type 1 TsaE [Coriobacteriales bacterium]
MSDAAQLPRRTGEGTFVSDSQESTIALGRVLGTILQPGDVLVLTGDLGAGKTQLTKGIAAGMGVTDDVTSPTFTIEMVYEGTSMPLYHFDLYRLDDPDQLEDTGLYDVLGGDGPCVIEWGEQFSDEIGPARLDVYVSRLDDDVQAGVEPPRQVRLVAHDERGRQLVSQLDRAVQQG